MTAALLALWLAAAAPPASASEPRVVSLVPLGNVDPALVKVAAEALQSRLGHPVRVESPRELPKSAWNASRKRWRAEKLLEALDADRPQGAWKVLGLTSAELSATKGEVPERRVRGEGEVGGRVCVASSWSDERDARTKADLHGRVADLVVHEVGHTLGLGHCQVKGCVMRAAEARAQEASTGQPCDACRKKLRSP
ncbi:MAG: hypothetical protein QM765_04875 [Myxococcales bacterium]